MSCQLFLPLLVTVMVLLILLIDMSPAGPKINLHSTLYKDAPFINKEKATPRLPYGVPGSSNLNWALDRNKNY
eukprot:TRINITY_DN2039_c1_g1_i1.p1 TRINITY_DN2039_c1_g1~~TRINITY_DN2039_c1_g1_i1.p1  ORF type:complete len:73 (-),score=3.21 TRINITY_DN2039_c1_g1_i1:65-283(-)